MKKIYWCVTLPVLGITLTLMLTACGFKGNLYVPGTEEQESEQSSSKPQKSTPQVN